MLEVPDISAGLVQAYAFSLVYWVFQPFHIPANVQPSRDGLEIRYFATDFL